MGALPEFERDLIRERTNAGLAAARARGRIGGRPRKLKTNGKVTLARQMFTDQSHSIPEICAALGISRATCGISPTEFQNLQPAARLHAKKDPYRSVEVFSLSSCGSPIGCSASS